MAAQTPVTTEVGPFTRLQYCFPYHARFQAVRSHSNLKHTFLLYVHHFRAFLYFGAAGKHSHEYT